MATGAEVAFARGPHAVLAHPIAVVDEVARWRRVLGGEVDVTAIAVAQRPLVLVLVTAEADGHLRAQRIGPRVGDCAVAANAVSMDRRVMLGVVKAQVIACELGPLAYVRCAMAPAARPFVVRLGVAPAAIGVGRQVQRAAVACALYPRVALDAVYPLDHVRAVLERVRRVRSPNPKYACARGE
jgi:hypothetical protein